MFFRINMTNRTTPNASHPGRSHLVKRASVALSLLAVLSVLFLPLAAAAQTSTTPALLVKLVSGLTAEQVAQVIARNGGTEISSIPALRLHVIAVDAASLESVRASYAADPQVARVELDQTRQIQTWPTDPLYPNQWYLPKIGWDQMFGVVSASGTA